MNILQYFLLLLFLPLLHSKNHCPTSYCPNNTLPIQHPFRLPNQKTPNCSYTNLTCTNHGIATLNLPHNGYFYIRDVDYTYSLIKLYDPDNCLPKRLMSLNLLYSLPLYSIFDLNYTFYSCPSELAALANLAAIDCLSNSSTTTVATHTVSGEVMTKLYRCNEIVTSSVPVGRNPPDFITNQTDLLLRWFENDCENCPHKATGLVPDYTVDLAYAVIAYSALIMPIILLFFSVFSTVYACTTSYCGSFPLDYPFKLEYSNPPNSCTYINLSCSGLDQWGSPVLSLPYGGDFYVRDIEYRETYIQLYDPSDCLMERLMKLNLSSSPFKAIHYQNYTFYTCPFSASLTSLYVLPIRCLGSNTSNTIATATLPSDTIFDLGCDIIGSWELPVLELYQFDNEGIYSDLYLKYDLNICSDCEAGGNKDKDDSHNLWSTFVGSSYFIPSIGVLATFLVTFFLQMVKLVAGRYGVSLDSTAADVQPEYASAAAAPPGSTAGGLDDSKINSCTELVVISDSRINISPDCNTCSICLDSYVPKDTVRSIAKCEHCFHAECIELWLRKNSTCPVCRAVLTDIVTLTDPGKCLPGRLMMKSVSPYPLEALFNKDYTYYTCPKGRITPPFTEIHCLSNSVNATIVAADLPNEFMREMDGCTSIFSSMIPVGWSDEYSFLELQLTWNVPGCRECEDLYTPLYSDDSKSNQVAKFLQSSAFIASAAVLITFSGLACLLRISKIIEGRATTASNTIEDAAATESTAATSTTVAPPGTTSETLGAEKSHVKSFSEVVFLGESQGALVSCSICIEEYSDKDRVRYLDQCGHFFHVECIDQWLQKNNTCPVCRTSLS
ncbi:hypothetical protein ACS0TY_019187 [Phlomoides rotata]